MHHQAPLSPRPPRPIQVFPGSVLLRIGMGPSGPTVPPLTWESEVEAALRDRQPYKLRVHVYQVWDPFTYASHGSVPGTAAVSLALVVVMA